MKSVGDNTVKSVGDNTVQSVGDDTVKSVGDHKTPVRARLTCATLPAARKVQPRRHVSCVLKELTR